MKTRILIFAILFFVVLTNILLASNTFEIISWNVESGGADPDVVAEQIKVMYDIDIWGFCEVKEQGWANKFERAAEADAAGDYEAILGTTGGSDKLMILYDKNQFIKEGSFEINWENRPWYTTGMTPRSALV